MMTILAAGLELNGDYRTGGGVYAHGALEDMLGFDLVQMPVGIDGKFTITKEGIYECVVLSASSENNSHIEATLCNLYYWVSGYGFNGLVVAKNDLESMEYAKKCYTNKTDGI